MTFDTELTTHLHELRFSTWYLEDAHIEITHPHSFVLQGLHLIPGHHASAPRGVVWLHAPGPHADLNLTSLRARTATDLPGERERLQCHLGNGWQIVPLEDQMPLVSAALRGRITEPADWEPSSLTTRTRQPA